MAIPTNFFAFHARTDTYRNDSKDFNTALQKAEWAEHAARVKPHPKRMPMPKKMPDSIRPAELNCNLIELTWN